MKTMHVTPKKIFPTPKKIFRQGHGLRAALAGPFVLGLLTTGLTPAAIAAPPPVPAHSADAFVDSIGLVGLGGPYLFHLDGARASLYNTVPVAPQYVLGVRNARYEIRPDTDMTPIIRLANDQGIRIDALVSWLWTDPYISKSADITNVFPMLRQLPRGSLALIEGNNESDMPFESGDFPRYASSTAAAQTNQAALYHILKADPEFKNIPVVAWTLGKNWPWGGNTGYGIYTSTNYDYESMHSYPGGDTIDGTLHAPGHNQWIKVADSIVPPGAPTKPIIVTETGFTSTMTGPDQVVHNSELAQAKVDMMLLAEDYQFGIVRTYLYAVGGQHPWSLDTRDDGTALPAGRALSFLTATLGESHWNRATHAWVGPHFKPGALAFSLSSASASVHDVLLEKSDGSFYLLLWNDVTVWDGHLEQDIQNPPVAVTVNLATAIAHAAALTMNNDGTYAKTPLPLAGAAGSQTLTLAVPDSVMLVHLEPQAR